MMAVNGAHAHEVEMMTSSSNSPDDSSECRVASAPTRDAAETVPVTIGYNGSATETSSRFSFKRLLKFSGRPMLLL